MPKDTNKESLVGFVNSFKVFEQKLDKVQEDVLYQGRVLADLKTMVKKLSDQVHQGSRIQPQDPKRKSVTVKSFPGKKIVKKTVMKKGPIRTNIDSLPIIPKYQHHPPSPIQNTRKGSLKTEVKKKLDKGDHHF